MFFSNRKPSKLSFIRIRPYRITDSPQLQHLVLQAISRGSASPYRVALHEHLFWPSSCISYLLFSAGLVAFVSRSTRIPRGGGALLMLGSMAFFFSRRRAIYALFRDHTKETMKEDLADVATYSNLQPVDKDPNNLTPSGPRGFWVAELEPPNGRGREIVGCVGLDRRRRDDPTTAGLRRLFVSPQHQRHGIGAQLLCTLVAHAQANKLASLFLLTTHYHYGAIALYERHTWRLASKVLISKGINRIWVLEYQLKLRPEAIMQDLGREEDPSVVRTGPLVDSMAGTS